MTRCSKSNSARMFASLLIRVKDDVRSTKNMAVLHEHARQLFHEVKPGDEWESVRGNDPGKTRWQIYDHCACLTRLYAVYSIFVEDLISEYLKILPQLYENYSELPLAVSRQHRTGFGQILLKLGDVGPYSHLREMDIIQQLSHSLTGGRPYVLLTDAFFIDRQNYRSDVLGKLLSSVGVENGISLIAKHSHMRRFLTERIGDTATFESELNNFVKLRNEAAHSEVAEVIGSAKFQTLADFLVVLCQILAEILDHSSQLRRVAIGQFLELGVVLETHYGGKIVVAKMNKASIAVGEQVIILRGQQSWFAVVNSLQIEDSERTSVEAEPGLELGLGLSSKCKSGDRIVAGANPEHVEQVQQTFDPSAFAPSFATDDEAGEEGAGAQQPPDGQDEPDSTDSNSSTP